MEKYQITSALLTEAIWGASKCKFVKNCNGYLNADHGEKGRIILEYLLSRIYGIHRVPGYEPEYKLSFSDISREVDGFTPQNIDEAEKDFIKMIEHVQKQVRNNEPLEDDSVELVRSLRPFECAEAIPQLLDGKNTITMPANIMTSYAYDGMLFCYRSDVSIKRKVPISNIIFWDKYIEAPSTICHRTLHMGEYEVWVLNDDIYGEITLDKGCFFIQNNSLIEEMNEKFKTRYYQRKYYCDGDERISNVYSIDHKPCEEQDFLTRYIIKRNQKNIKKLLDLL